MTTVRFLEQAKAHPDELHTHPVLGPIGVHHLLQFGLVDVEAGAMEKNRN